ncbi:MAG: bifunctional hydroxymethylpyrimidine kinase/phosphomethylpyrimidine kinase [Halobacteria archaeon]
MVEKEVVLTVAGSDSGGGAGIQADLKTMEAFDVFGTSAITSVTAQNTLGVDGVEDVSPEMVGEQIDSVCTDYDVGCVKTGMVSNAEIIDVVAEKIREYDLDAVVDPVMVSETGDRLLDRDAEDSMREKLVPEARLVTPNVPETTVLTDIDVENIGEMESGAKILVQEGANAALVKGGHVGESGEESVVDVLFTGSLSSFRKPKVEDAGTHGSGCTLSSAIAAGLAKDMSLHSAVSRAEEFMYRAVKFGLDVGEGEGPVHHMAEIRNEVERFDALRKVRSAVESFENRDISKLVPEVGMNVAVATPYALEQDEVAAVEGRIHRVTDGVSANEDVWFGASGHIARFLLEMREYDDLRAACNLRNNEYVSEKVEGLFDAKKFDRTGEPGHVDTMEWSARKVMEDRDSVPDAVIDGGAVGKEPMIRILASSAGELRQMVLRLEEALS